MFYNPICNQHQTKQVAFDTLPGQWTTVELPFERFFPVIRNRLNYKLPGLAGVKRERVATSFGIVYRWVDECLFIVYMYLCFLCWVR